MCGKKAGKIRHWGPRGALAPLLSLCFYSADALLLLIFYSAAENSAERWEAQTEKIRDGSDQECKLKNPDLKKVFFETRSVFPKGVHL